MARVDVQKPGSSPGGPSGALAAEWPGQAGEHERTRARSSTLMTRLRRDWVMILLVLPGLLYFTVFYYITAFGYIIAFQDYRPYLGYVDSPFVGLENFRKMLGDAAFWQAFRNTITISLMQLVLYFPAPIALALLLNSIVSTQVRRVIQNVVYLPHFLSWVIIVAIFQNTLGSSGMVAQLALAAGFDPPRIMGNPDLFKWLVTAEIIWRETGWGTVIYLAALASIDADLYEAAAVDGASRWRRLWHVTLPGIVAVTILLLILRLGNILTVGFEQILLQRDAVGAAAGEVLDTYTYYNGIIGGQWGITAAAGLVKFVLGVSLVWGANRLAHRFGQPGVYE